MALVFPLAFRLEHDRNVLDVALHPTHRLLASALDDGLVMHVYDPPSEGPAGSLQLWQGHRLRPFAGAVQPDCTAVCFVAASGGGETGGSVVVGSPSGSLFAADVETGREAWSPRAGAHTARIKAAAALGPHQLVSGDSRGMVQFWDVRTGGATNSLQLPVGGVTDLSPVPDKDALLAASSNSLEGSLSTISMRSAQVLSSWQHQTAVHAVTTLHGCRTVVCGDEHGRWGFGRWGQLRGKEVAFRAGHGSAAVSALVSCDNGTGVVSASSDGSIRASRIEGPPVEVSSLAPVQAHAGGSRVRLALSGSGSYVASAAVGETSVQLWHTSLLFSRHGSPAQAVGTPLPKLTLRRDEAAATAAAAAAEAAAGQQQQQQQGVDDADEQLCIICLTNERTGGFAHGGTMHSGYCVECIRAEKQRRPGKCPACRGAVDAYIERMFT